MERDETPVGQGRDHRAINLPAKSTDLSPPEPEVPLRSAG